MNFWRKIWTTEEKFRWEFYSDGLMYYEPYGETSYYLFGWWVWTKYTPPTEQWKQDNPAPNIREHFGE